MKVVEAAGVGEARSLLGGETVMEERIGRGASPLFGKQ